MKIKSEKGFSGVDIAIGIVIITILISTITVLYTQNSVTAKNIERNSIATEYAIREIENIKTKSFEEFKGQGNQAEEQYFQLQNEENKVEIKDQQIEDTPYYKTIKIQDYKYLNNSNINDETIQEDILKKLTVEISYKTGKNIETVSLSTIIKGY